MLMWIHSVSYWFLYNTSYDESHSTRGGCNSGYFDECYGVMVDDTVLISSHTATARLCLEQNA